MINQIHPNKIRQILFISVLIALGLVICAGDVFYAGCLFGCCYPICTMRNAMIRLVVDYKWKTPWLHLCLMVVSLILLVMPCAWLTSVVIDKLGPVMDDPQNDQSFIRANQCLFASHLNVNIFSAKKCSHCQWKLVGIAQSTLDNVSFWAIWPSCILCSILCSPVSTTWSYGWDAICH